MFSTGEIIVLLGVAGLLIGPKELPGLARGAGRLTGRAAAYLSRSRAAFMKFSDENEITELHKEMQQSLAQLRQIQYELRSGLNVLEPGPLTRKAMALSEQQLVKQSSASAEMPRSSSAAQASLRPAAAQAVSQEPDESQLHSGQPAEAEVPIMDSLEQEIERLQRLEQRTAQLQTSQSGLSDSRRRNVSGMEDRHTQAAGSVAGRPQLSSSVPETTHTRSEQGLGISAVSLGIAPDRRSDPPTGSDIALDALAEEEVAHSVRSLLEQHSGPQGKQ